MMKTIKTLLGIMAIALIFCTCKKEIKATLETTELSIALHNTALIAVTENAKNVTFTSDNANIAEVSASGLVTAKRLGHATITVKQGGKEIGICRIVIRGVNNTFKEPYLVFGVSRDVIKTYETRTVLFEEEEYVVYEGENSRTLFVEYGFKDAKYEQGIVFSHLNNMGLIQDFLKERYNTLSPDELEEDVFFELLFLSEDLKTAGFVVTETIQQTPVVLVVYLNPEDIFGPMSATPTKSGRIQLNKSALMEVQQKVKAQRASHN
jgi:hypothetical protein